MQLIFPGFKTKKKINKKVTNNYIQAVPTVIIDDKKTDRVVSTRIDLLTEKEQFMLVWFMREAKRRFAPHARITFTEGDQQQLP